MRNQRANQQTLRSLRVLYSWPPGATACTHSRMTDFSWPAIFHGRDDTHFGSTLAEMVAEELKTGNKGLNPRARSVTTGPMGDAAIIGIGLSHASTPKSKKKPAGNKFILHEKFGSMNPRDTPPETTYKTKEEFVAWLAAQSDATLVTPWDGVEPFDVWVSGEHTAGNPFANQRLCRARFLGWLPDTQVARLASDDLLAAEWVKASLEAAAAKEAAAEAR